MNVILRKRPNTDKDSALLEKKPKPARYLEDNTPIRTIQVNDLANNVTDEYLRGYFERDGPVEEVKIVRKTNDNKTENLAYVTFVTPEDAAQLLGNKDDHQNFPISKFSIKEADASLQPKLDLNSLNLEGVNDDCLLKILSYLPITDIISLSKTSTRMKYISQEIFRKYSNFSYGKDIGDPSIDETNLPDVLKAVGSHIRSLEWHCLEPQYLNLLAKYATKVTKFKLRIHTRSLTIAELRKNKKFFAKLTTLHIVKSSIFDGAVKIMVSGRKLKTLILENCENVRAKFLNKLNRSNLRNVRIIGCVLVEDLSFADWSNKLTSFAFNGCRSVTKCLQPPPEKLKKLKTLELGNVCYHEHEIAKKKFKALRNVKSFKITRNVDQGTTSCNILIDAISLMVSLESIYIDTNEINDATIDGLQRLKNIKSFTTNDTENRMGNSVYAALAVALPDLQELVISFTQDNTPKPKIIGDMINKLPKLKYFSYSFMTWQILEAILLTRRKGYIYTTLTIGIPDNLFHDRKKVLYDVASKHMIKLTQLPKSSD